ncbi:MAG: MerR family transcriptional regulator [Candidatus Lambdaproteobacteria bacterium RIFOXYD1_FULL_56_27]|uniref:MerR family transcriptional regulator n=1 Tax=Candidatus Lambdaproteobacteria bacterium RIFOXYD2_FULL_56_26 TaxID=1817773 RepID=A0A1F6H025_9PROT|nr:MAG: MerR family transcriptional regulator [Candidatus Lambdaproteobacteria bacterium RIFOXYC1_FULL_56_13]OGH03630.1 MAG: MerR family transcriptional regulator [Candidatus Lambdaproteobacteria bacterium RIFOXYD2_FULL_56_26]OGH06794.1 MAG: MerR family transcriptional regulator [Candidatus Lambdaproteobacteria bacterium RIFOXYD1_FULL_56_27]
MNPPKLEMVQIGDLAKQLGITTRTIRYYEEIGLMPSPERLGSGVRCYGKEGVLRLKFILKLKELGITLAEMQELSDLYRSTQAQTVVMPRLVEILDGHIAKIDQKISRISLLRQELANYRKKIAELPNPKNQP